MTKFKQAVCIILPCEAGVLAVSRKGNIHQWGLPGGKVDPGETLEQAIIRETKEEIGLDISPMYLVPVFTDVAIGEVNYETTTFVHPTLSKWTMNRLIPEEGMATCIMPIKELCDERVSPFAEYNKKLFKALNTYGCN